MSVWSLSLLYEFEVSLIVYVLFIFAFSVIAFPEISLDLAIEDCAYFLFDLISVGKPFRGVSGA